MNFLKTSKFKTTALVAVAFAIGIEFNNYAMSGIPSNFNIAVVDVNKVVAQSSEVQELKKEQEVKMQELQKWLETVRADVQKQSTDEGKKALIKKYDSQFAKKQEAIKKNYASELKSIDKNISGIIAKEAKAKNYDIVLAKGVVLYGGADITGEIAKLVK